MGHKYVKKYLTKDVLNTEENYGANAIRGFRNKTFRLFERSFFSDLLNDLKTNPNCQYETYLNDLIKSGYTPKWIMALDKPVHDQDTGIIEVLSSRILNAMGCPTTYETIIEKDYISLRGKKLGNQKRILSVDFNKEDEDFYTLTDFDYDYFDNKFSSLEFGLKWILDDIYKSKYLKSEKFREIDIKNVLEDFIYSYLIRVFILEDKDYKPRNIGIIIDNKNQRIRLAPNYDFEYVLDAILSANYMTNNIETSLKFCLNNNHEISRQIQYIKTKYPNVFNRFLCSAQNLITPTQKKTILDGIFDKIVPQDGFEKQVHTLAKLGIEKNINNILEISANLNKVNCEKTIEN